ncbi:MAG: hypothetical protein JWQ70_1984, partial [Aeromicrobium sp.]|nr:hypothetical protein [Aeromicrobium sp.]
VLDPLMPAPFLAGTVFEAFFDDAALFPPANAPMAEAVRAHLARRGTPDGQLVGPFVCPTARLDELRDALGHGHLELALVSTVDELADVMDRLAAQQNLTLAAVELKGPVDSLPELPVGLRVFVERGWRDSYDLPDGAMLKLRCGGAEAADTPSSAQLGQAIQHCVEHDLPFKLTAGLHHAVRTEREHGFLNVLASVNSAIDGSDPVPSLLDNDAAELKVSNPGAVRRLFRSIGTCSIDEPLTDLRALELI